MRTLRIFAPLILVLTLGLAWFVIIAEPFSHWLAQRRAAHNGTVIGRIVHAEGSVRRIHGANVDLAGNGMELRDGDRLQTSVESKALFTLNSQDEFEIPSGTLVQFRLWSPTDAASPVYLEPLLGELIHLRAGVRGKAYVVRDGRLYLPGQRPLRKAMALTVLKSAPLDLHLAESDVTIADEGGGDTQGAATSDTTNSRPTPSMAEPETLSNEYIDQTIADHQAQLQKCWLSRLKDVPDLKGQIILEFEISARGKVKDTRIADASLNDEILKKCVLSVFERIAFQSFKGAEISLSYPIKFE